jgi:hypothetical protein
MPEALWTNFLPKHRVLPPGGHYLCPRRDRHQSHHLSVGTLEDATHARLEQKRRTDGNHLHMAALKISLQGANGTLVGGLDIVDGELIWLVLDIDGLVLDGRRPGSFVFGFRHGDGSPKTADEGGGRMEREKDRKTHESTGG